MSSEIGLIVMPTPCRWRKAASGAPLCEVCSGSPESLARGMLTRIPHEPRRALCFSVTTFGYSVTPIPKTPGLRGGEGCPREKRTTLKRSLLLPRETAGAGTGRRAVLRFHSTAEGGEPQGSRKGRPRYPLEGRDEQVDVSVRSRMHGTLNPGRHVKWS
jgi:hypothetical protein